MKVSTHPRILNLPQEIKELITIDLLTNSPPHSQASDTCPADRY